MKRLAFNAYLASAEDGPAIESSQLDATVMCGTALTVDAIRSIADALRVPTPKWRVLRTCVPGCMTNAEETGAAVLDRFFANEQSATVIHQSTKVSEGKAGHGSLSSQPELDSRPAQDYRDLVKELDGHVR